jgi:hypothetical protein
MRCGPDHHTVNFFHGPDAKLHHMAFELKDFMHLQNACELMGQRKVPILWGPLRHGPGHNIATYHRNQDGQMIEFFCELDKMLDEELGYFEPRPWHRDRPQRPKVWAKDPNASNYWGIMPTDEMHHHRLGPVAGGRLPQALGVIGSRPNYGRTAGASTGIPRARHIR